MLNPRRLVLMLLFLSPLVLFVNSTSAAAFKRVHEGDEAPAFSLPDVTGAMVDLTTYKDAPLTIVSFWALWSPEIRALLKDVQRLRRGRRQGRQGSGPQGGWA